MLSLSCSPDIERRSDYVENEKIAKSEDSKSFIANRKRTEVRDVQGGFQGDLPFLFSRDLGWLYKQDTPKMALCNLW